MPELKAFYQPRSLPEAIALLEEHGDRARPLAGGTAIALSRSQRVEVLVDLGRLGLDRIEEVPEPGRRLLRLGAMVSCSQLLRHLAGRPAWLLPEATAAIGTRILQNHVTVGGNSVMVYAWSDLPVALQCLDATFVVQGPNKGRERREIDARTFYSEHPTRVLGLGELLVEIAVPLPAPGSGSAYLKLGRNATDQALASAAAAVTQTGGRIQAAQISVGAVRGLPQRLTEAAGTLVGARPEPDAIAAAASRGASEAKITADYRGSAEYRKELLRVLLEDALTLAARRAGGAA